MGRQAAASAETLVPGRDSLHCWAPLLGEISDGADRYVFASCFPRTVDEVQLEGDWEAVIASTKPNPKDPAFVGTLVGFYVTWMARWLPRCVPDRDIRRSAFQHVSHTLIGEWEKKSLYARFDPPDLPENFWQAPLRGRYR